jgi:tRNA(Ile)-lysidine synthase
MVMDLLQHIRELPPERGGIRAGERLVVGLSGGADSVALTGLLRELGVRIVAAHLDHRLRPDSNEDRAFCREFARELGVPFASARTDVGARAAVTGEGVEAAARRLRYAWLEKVRRHYRADRIAVAHHLDDHAETLLLWLGRGTGLSGLAGIPAVRGRIVRPLREVRRATLRAECERRLWAWREDGTNAEPISARNRLRHGVMPALEDALGPGAIERMGAMSARAAAERAALEQFAADFLERTLIKASNRRIEVDRALWREAPQGVILQALRNVLAELELAGPRQRWNEARYRDVLGFIRDARTGQRADLPGGGVLDITRHSLVLSGPNAESADGPPTEFMLRERVLTASPAEASFWGRDRACFDADRVHPPFKLRKVQPGDRMQPFGMSGQKRLARLLAEKAVARHDRWSSLVVEDQERIVWAVGLTTSEHTRITEDTRRVLQLSLSTRPTDGKGPRP